MSDVLSAEASEGEAPAWPVMSIAEGNAGSTMPGTASVARRSCRRALPG